ncbi:TonB-dependent receptor plug domain-containing protein [Robiginitomaculum antarcticum]|uniref:TonB-dependent receptor plug domain-containing protein n=1 Tax=Robiginitomaculum antarcticum TaxID=437507 RepID=UPI0003A88E00|nr:TonB-dependent receptor plug domain-containing protein [Robiginitomaculum antarcticum]
MLKIRKPLLAVASSLTLMTAALPAFAQTANQQSFDQEYFKQYAPRTALDMIAQVPGFSLEGASDRRGLGQGGANVLINGERLTGKTDVGSQLNRIPATNVVRVEIKDGASLSIPGLSGQVANIVTSKGKGLSGTWSWESTLRDRNEPNFSHIHFTVSGEKGPLSYTAELRSEAFRQAGYGREDLIDASGTVFETRDEIGYDIGQTPGVTLDLAWKPKEEHVGNLNLEYNHSNYGGSETSQRTAGTSRGNDVFTLARFSEDEWNAKIGADYEFPFLNGKLKTIAYNRFEHSPTQSQFEVFTSPDNRADGSIFNRVADESESILRTEYSWIPSEGRDWQISLEGALNTLDIDADLQVLDGGAYRPEPLKGASSKVEEIRTEASITHSRKMSEKWNLQASLGAEYSEISQSNGGLTRDFFRPKGFIASTYKPSDSFSIRTKVEREVGQLNFFDFISSVDISDDFNTTGNINLVPAQSWNLETEFDKDFGDGNSLKIRVYGELITDLVDRIPIGKNGDAVGNIDEAMLYGLDSTLTLKGEKWGYKGTELTLKANVQDSDVDDPLTGGSRRLNNASIYNTQLSFRHDIENTDYAYGFGLYRSEGSPDFRLRTISEAKFNAPDSSIFVEHKDIMGLKLRLTAFNLFDFTQEAQRQIFTDRRDIGTLDFTEFRRRKYGRTLSLELSGTY